MGIEDVVVVATVREEIRTQRSFVDTAGIKRRIKATQARMVAHVASDDVTPDDTPVSSESEAEKEPPKEAVTGIGSKTDNYKVTKGLVRGIPPKVGSYSVAEEVRVAIPSEVNNYNVAEGIAVATPFEVNSHNVAEGVAVAIPSEVNSYNVAEGVAVATPSKLRSYSVAEDVAVAASEAADIPGPGSDVVSLCVWLVNGTESLTKHCGFKEETAPDPSLIDDFPAKGPKKKSKLKKERTKKKQSLTPSQARAEEPESQQTDSVYGQGHISVLASGPAGAL